MAFHSMAYKMGGPIRSLTLPHWDDPPSSGGMIALKLKAMNPKGPAKIPHAYSYP